MSTTCRHAWQDDPVIPHFSDHAANERTYLAWVRTAIAVMAFGFLIERFDLFLASLSHVAAHAVTKLHLRGTEWAGLLLIIFGALMILLATLRFLRCRRNIEEDRNVPYAGMLSEKLLAAIMVLMALFLVAYVGREVVAFG
jgi:putative membrane protein